MWEYTTYPATFQMCVRMYAVKYERSGFLNWHPVMTYRDQEEKKIAEIYIITKSRTT